MVKKTIITILFFLIFLIIYFLQANIFVNLKIAGVMPNLFILLILYIGLFSNTIEAIGFGVIMGLVLDFIYGKAIGITAVMFCIIGYLGAYFDKNFSKESKIKIIIMSVVATIIFETGLYSLGSLIIGYELEWIPFARILGIEILYNTLITIILYPFIQKTGYSVDRAFKRSNILTRYF